jgi:hypothetical protein
MPASQADAVVDVVADVCSQRTLVTHADLITAVQPIRTDLCVLKWTVGVSTAGLGLLLVAMLGRFHL